MTLYFTNHSPRHLRKSHCVNHKGMIALNHKGCIRDTDFPLPMHDGKNPIGDLLDRLFGPLTPHTHTLFSSPFCCFTWSATSWIKSPSVTTLRTLSLVSTMPNAFSNLIPSSTRSRESTARSSCRLVSGVSTSSVPICSLIIS